MTTLPPSDLEASADNKPEISVSPAKSKAATPKAEPKPVPAPIAHPVSRHVYGTGSHDDVHYARIRDTTKTNKSLTVKHLQRKLDELGFHEAAADIDGKYGLLTERSVNQWQEKIGHPIGDLTPEQFTEIFEGDPNVRVVLD
jgi:peptidoglycan hydrolase-like protein with peptidoglycan-binding domain